MRKFLLVTFSSCPNYSIIFGNIFIVAKFNAQIQQQPSFLYAVYHFSNITAKSMNELLHDNPTENQTDLISSG